MTYLEDQVPDAFLLRRSSLHQEINFCIENLNQELNAL